MISDSPSVRLELDSRPECLTLVRGVLAALAESLGFASELLDDIKMAVSEACTNVVLHAYGGNAGSLVVRLAVREDRVEVSVRDRGAGFPHAPPHHDRMGVGLAVIGALADRAEFSSLPEGGTEVRMTFAHRGTGAGMLDLPAAETGDQQWVQALAGEVVVWLTPVAMLSGILGRAARTLAAGARFSLDRFGDLYLVTDAIAAHAQRAADGNDLGFAITAAHRRLELTVGPFRAGSGEELGVDGRSRRQGLPLAFLADRLATRPAGDAELLCVLVVDHRLEKATS